MGALEGLRQHLGTQVPALTTDWLAVDTTPVPVKHRCRASTRRHRDFWDGPADLRASFGYCAALREWFYGFRLAVLTPLQAAVPAFWALVPARVNEREVALELLTGVHHALLLAATGLGGRAMTATLAAQPILLVTPPVSRTAAKPPAWLRQFIAHYRHRIEDVFNTLKDRFALCHHRAHTVWGLLTRTVSKLTALTLVQVWREAGLEVA